MGDIPSSFQRWVSAICSAHICVLVDAKRVNKWVGRPHNSLLRQQLWPQVNIMDKQLTWRLSKESISSCYYSTVFSRSGCSGYERGLQRWKVCSPLCVRHGRDNEYGREAAKKKKQVYSSHRKLTLHREAIADFIDFYFWLGEYT